ncbi:MAG: AAA family ATPase [Streptosporangiaceae bacterium]
MGGGLLSEAVIRAWDKLRSRGRPDAGQAELRDALAAELEARLTLGTPAAAALRDEVASVLRGVDAVQVALTATVEESAAGVREVLVRGLREMGEEFTEFGWVLDEVNRQLSVIAEDVAQTAATTRVVADNQQQTLVEIAMLRQEARSAFRYRADRPGPAILAGPLADEERTAAFDAAGVAVSAECPYLGLAAFQPEDAGRFFGREQLTAELVARAGEQLARPGLLMVLGPSGSGKSSLLRAGLLPAVAAGVLPARGSWAWPRDLMTPGRRPLLELATRIASLAGIPSGALEADLRTDPARITGAIRQALLTNARRQANTLGPAAGPVVADLGAGQQVDEPDTGSLTTDRQVATGPRLVLIVDQFEEIFTQCTDEQERRTFIKALCDAADTAAPGITADGGPARGQVDAREAPAVVVIGIRADFYARCTAYPELVPHLQNDQVLVGPIGEAGLREAIEKPAATAGLVIDAALVEVLLADLGLHAHTDARPASTAEGSGDHTVITGWDSYPAGRLALLSYALQQTWRNREGRRLTVAGYRATGGIDGAVAQAADNVCDRLDPAGQAALQRVLLRLVTFGEGTPDTRRRVTFAELAGSGDSERATPTRAVLADLIAARLVTTDADTVEITHETLLTAWPRLRQWLTEDRAGLRTHRDLTGAAHDWQQQGRDPSRLFRGTRLAVARDWAAHHGQDLNDDERAFLAASQHDRLRATRRRRTALAALAVLTLLSLTAAGVAIKLGSDALAARDVAIANEVTVEAGQLTATNPSLAAQLDVAANQISATSDTKTRLIDTTTTPLASRLTGPMKAVFSVAFSPDGRILAAGSSDHKVWLWNLANPARPTPLGRPLNGPTDTVTSVAFSPDGQTLAAGSSDHKVWLWNLANPARPTPLSRLMTRSANVVNSVAFSPHRRILAAGSSDGTVWLWNLANPAHPTRLGQPLNGPAPPVTSAAFSPDGRILAAGSSDHKVWLWNLANPARPTRLGRPLNGPADTVTSVAFSPDGQTLVAGTNDGKVWLWNLANPARPTRLGQPLNGPAEAVASAAFSPHGQTLAAGSSDHKVWLWNLANPADPTRLGQPLTDSTEDVTSVAYSPDRQTLAASSNDGRVWLWNLPSSVLTGPTNVVSSVAFSPHRQTLAAGTNDGRVWLWNLANPARPTQLGQPLTGTTDQVTSVAFSRDGRTLAGSSDDEVWLWNLANPAHPTPLGQPLNGPADTVTSVAFSLDGRTLAAGSYDGRVWLWNLANPARPTLLRQFPTGPTGPVISVAFSPDGQTLAAGNNDGTVWLWNLANPARPTLFGQPLNGPTPPVTSVAFSPDGQTLAAGSNDHNVWLWNLSIEDAIQRICATTSNTLTPAQWNQYIPQLPYDPPCPPRSLQSLRLRPRIVPQPHRAVGVAAGQQLAARG